MTIILIAHRLSTVKRADNNLRHRGGKVGRVATNLTVGGTHRMKGNTRVAFGDTSVAVGNTNVAVDDTNSQTVGDTG